MIQRRHGARRTGKFVSAPRTSVRKATHCTPAFFSRRLSPAAFSKLRHTATPKGPFGDAMSRWSLWCAAICATLTYVRAARWLLSGILLFVFSDLVLADDKATCLSKAEIKDEVRSTACTRAIDAGRYRGGQLSELYHSRGGTQKDDSAAMLDYDLALRFDPKNVSALIDRAAVYTRRREYNRAVQELTFALSLPLSEYGRKVAHQWRGRAHRGNGDYDRAIADHTQAIRIDPKYANAFVARALAWEGKKDIDRAAADYSEAIRLEPGLAATATAYHNRGVIWLNKKDYDRAIADLREAIRLDPKFANAYHSRAIAYATRKAQFDRADWSLALDDLSEALRINPQSAGALSDRCEVRAKLSQVQEALSDCVGSLALRPSHADALKNRGFVHLRLGELDSAISNYDDALKLRPKDAEALYGRGFARHKKADAAGGDADIAAAKAIQADIAEEFARYGVK